MTTKLSINFKNIVSKWLDFYCPTTKKELYKCVYGDNINFNTIEIPNNWIKFYNAATGDLVKKILKSDPNIHMFIKDYYLFSDVTKLQKIYPKDVLNYTEINIVKRCLFISKNCRIPKNVFMITSKMFYNNTIFYLIYNIILKRYKLYYFDLIENNISSNPKLLFDIKINKAEPLHDNMTHATIRKINNIFYLIIITKQFIYRINLCESKKITYVKQPDSHRPEYIYNIQDNEIVNLHNKSFNYNVSENKIIYHKSTINNILQKISYYKTIIELNDNQSIIITSVFGNIYMKFIGKINKIITIKRIDIGMLSNNIELHIVFINSHIFSFGNKYIFNTKKMEIYIYNTYIYNLYSTSNINDADTDTRILCDSELITLEEFKNRSNIISFNSHPERIKL